MPTMQNKKLWLCADGLTRFSLFLLSHRVIMEGDRPFLPDDIIVNILTRISVKSLIRFQCVCKHWKSLIKSPSFITDHLHHSSHQNPSLLLRWCRFKSSGFRWVLLDCNMREHVVQSSPLINSLSSCFICGSSNGLLCLEGGSTNSILLWNPATKEIRQVPTTVNDFEGIYHIGFGFSPIVNDYKIVLIYMTLKDGSYPVNRVEVYSLITKSWKEVEFRNLESICVVSPPVSANGDIFWFGYKAHEREDDDFCSVVSFDIANEIFTLIPIPPIGDRLIKKLIVYENNLALLCVRWTIQDEYSVELWVMKEGLGTSGERWTWTNTYAGNLCRGLLKLCPVTIWRNEIVCQAEVASDALDDDPKTFLYFFNPASNELKTFCIGVSECDFSLLIHNYVESLVSIGNIQVENP